MSFKIHLIIICFITVVVYATWQLMSSTQPAQVSAPQATPQSPYSISIIRATWGADCRERINNEAPIDSFARKEDSLAYKLRDNNVLLKVSELCNGKLRCDVPLSPAVLGQDPMPDCGGKALEVEYRCYSFDRPWAVKSSTEGVSINCDLAAQ